MLHIMNTPLAFCEQNFFLKETVNRTLILHSSSKFNSNAKVVDNTNIANNQTLLFVTHNKINFYPPKSGAPHISLLTLQCRMGTIYLLVITTHNHRRVIHDHNFHHHCCSPGHHHGHSPHHHSCHTLHLQGCHLLHQCCPADI